MKGFIDFTGDAPAGSTIEVFEGDRILATAKADDEGSWKAGNVALPIGRHEIKAVAKLSNGATETARSISVNVFDPGDCQMIEANEVEYDVGDDVEATYCDVVEAVVDGCELEAEMIDAVLEAAGISVEQYAADIEEERELRQRPIFGSDVESE